MPTQRNGRFISSIFISFLFVFLAKLGLGRDFYWINNDGNWDDGAHWSLASGGRSGSNIPGAEDNVIFDHNSFDSNSIVSIDTEKIKIGSFTAKGLTHLVSIKSNRSTELVVNGSLIIETHKLKVTNVSAINLTGSGGKNVIQSQGHIFQSSILFSKNCNYQLLTDLIIGELNDLHFVSGIFSADNAVIKAHNIYNTNHSVTQINVDKTTILNTGYWFGELNNVKGKWQHIGQLKNDGIHKSREKAAVCSINVVSDYNGRDISCTNADDAILKLEINPDPPVGTYTFEWNGPGGQTWDTQTISDIGPGSYSVVVKLNGSFECYAEKLSLEEPTEIRLVEKVPITNPACSYSCDGGSTIEGNFPKEIQGGTFPYSLTWNKGKVNEETGTPASQLCVGFNTLQITDVNDCPGVDTILIIVEPVSMKFNPDIIDVACNGGSTGSILLHPNGENGGGTSSNYTATYDPGSGPIAMPGLTVGGLSVGSYLISVSDQSGCVNDTTIVIDQPDPLNATISEKEDLICNSVCEGKITLSPSNGTRPYTYKWYDKNTGLTIGVVDSFANNLCAGTYYAEVKDANNCIFITPDIEITEPSAMTSTITSKDVICFGECNGTTTVTASGGSPFPGSPEYKYNWFKVSTSLPIAQTNDVATNLCPDDYFCIIEDANGCKINSSQTTVSEPNALNVSILKKNPKCFGNCNGELEAVVLGGIPDYSFQWKNISADTVFGLDTIVIDGLCKDRFSVLVKDKNNCSVQCDTVELIQPDKLTPVLTTTDVNCTTPNTGSAQVTITTGTPPYEYFWSSSANKTNIENNLVAGNYTVRIADSNLCDTIISFQINSPDPVSITLSTSDPSCANVCDGNIISIVTGGSGNYSYQWFDELNDPIPGANSSFLSGQCFGKYTLTVFDNITFCSSSKEGTLNISVGVKISLDSKTQTTCKSICDAEAVLSTTGGVPPYVNHIWFDESNGNPTGHTGENPTNLCAGDYFVVVEDDVGCVDTLKNIEITKLSEILASFVGPDSISCFGDCSGIASISGNGGKPPYKYEWFDNLGSSIGSVDNISNLCEGDYAVVITDDNTCTSDSTKFSVFSYPAYNILKDSTEIGCNGLCDGKLKVTVTGGAPNYSYQWDGGTGNQTGPEVNNLCAGLYNVTITDSKLCDTIVSFEVVEPGILILDVVKEDIPCFGNKKGKITVTPSGGTAPYFYKWLDGNGSLISGANDSILDNLSPGKYTAIVNDIRGCIVKSEIEILEQTKLVIDDIIKDNICFGKCEGSISTSVSGGLFPYSFEWLDSSQNPIPGEKNPLIENLCSGKYYLKVKDASSCTGIDSFLIIEPIELTITPKIEGNVCFGECTGEISLDISGGSAPYKIKWTDKDGTHIGSNDTISNLCAGNYSVLIEDASFCTKLIGSLVINEHPDIEADFIVDSAVCNANNGKLTVVPKGIDQYTYQWFSNLMDPLGTDSIEENLESGIYHVNLTSKSTGCVKLFTVSLSNKGAPVLSTDSVISPNCYGSCDGAIFITVTGSNTPFKYLWSPGGTITEDLENICSGNYSLEVENVLGCKLFENYAISQPDSIAIIAVKSDAACGSCNGSIRASVKGGIEPYTYQWLDSSKIPIAGEKDSLIENLCSGKYFLRVKDAKNCIRIDSFMILKPDELLVDVEKGNKVCFGGCEGKLKVNISGGKPPYKVVWKDGAGFVIGLVDSVSKLCGGLYSVFIEDANLCSKNIDSILIEEFPDIKADIKIDSALCQANDGKITAIPQGVDQYTYQWFDHLMNPLGTDSIESNLSSGIYHVNLTSKSTGCSKVFTTSLSNSGMPKLTIDSIVSPSCFNSCDGSVFITALGANGPFNYLWNPGGVSKEDLEDACAGDYLLEIKNSLGCKLFENIRIDEPDSIFLTSVVNNATCGDCNGSIVVNGPNLNNYNFAWSNGGTTNSIADLCSGKYKLLVSDKNTGCSKEYIFNVNPSDGPLLSVDFKKNPTCSSLCNGIIEVSPSGGEVPYLINWLHNGSNNNRLDNLCEGNYTVFVEDNKGCSSTIDIELVKPKAIQDSVYIVPAVCGQANGQIHINLIGGVSPLTISWTHNGSSSPILTDLLGGLYTANVQDFNGCVESFTYNVPNTDIPEPSFEAHDAQCAGVCTGKIILKGNLTGKNYKLLDKDGDFITNINDSITGLCPEKYWVVLDSMGCENIEECIIESPDSLLLMAKKTEHISCAGFCDGMSEVFILGGNLPYKFEWNDPKKQKESRATNLCGGTWKVKVIDQNNCFVEDSALIIEPKKINVIIEEFKHPVCSGIDDGVIDLLTTGGAPAYVFSWTSSNGFVSDIEDINGLKEGAYFLELLDTNKCLYLDTFYLFNEKEVNANAGLDQNVCLGDSVVLLGDGGNIYSWFNSDGVLIGDEERLDLKPDTGLHSFILNVADGICFERDTVAVKVFPLPVVDAGNDIMALRETYVTMGGSPTTTNESEIVWSPDINISGLNETNPSVFIDFPITYYLEVTGQNECVNIDSVLVKPVPDIVIPTGISPNNDGANDVWKIDGISEYPKANFEIYSRWGHLLYTSAEGYKNDWDGTIDGRLLPAGTYFYIILLNHPFFPDPLSGPITIFR